LTAAAEEPREEMSLEDEPTAGWGDEVDDESSVAPGRGRRWEPPVDLVVSIAIVIVEEAFRDSICEFAASDGISAKLVAKAITTSRFNPTALLTK